MLEENQKDNVVPIITTKEKETPSFILSEYVAVVQIDLEGSGIESWDDVEDHYIKWGELHATLKDGRSVVIEGTFDETDYKWGEKAFIYDNDFNIIQEI